MTGVVGALLSAGATAVFVEDIVFAMPYQFTPYRI
jgi:hypothetical protein